MSPLDRLQRLASHFTSAAPIPSSVPRIHEGDSHEFHHKHNFHTLSPTSFLWRAAQIEPDVSFLVISSAIGKSQTTLNCSGRTDVKNRP
jgi:hypothetical protein